MKKFIYIMAGLLLMGVGSAKAQKIGHVDSRAILNEMPEKEAAEKAVAELARDEEKEIERQKQRYSREYEEYMKARETLSAEMRAAREKDLQGMLEQMDNYQAGAEQRVMQRQQVEIDKLTTKIKDAIKVVAKAQSLTYVIDVSTVLYSEGGIDVTNAVRKQMGLPEKTN